MSRREGDKSTILYDDLLYYFHSINTGREKNPWSKINAVVNSIDLQFQKRFGSVEDFTLIVNQIKKEVKKSVFSGKKNQLVKRLNDLVTEYGPKVNKKKSKVNKKKSNLKKQQHKKLPTTIIHNENVVEESEIVKEFSKIFDIKYHKVRGDGSLKFNKIFLLSAIRNANKLLENFTDITKEEHSKLVEIIEDAEDKFQDLHKSELRKKNNQNIKDELEDKFLDLEIDIDDLAGIESERSYNNSLDSISSSSSSEGEDLIDKNLFQDIEDIIEDIITNQLGNKKGYFKALKGICNDLDPEAYNFPSIDTKFLAEALRDMIKIVKNPKQYPEFSYNPFFREILAEIYEEFDNRENKEAFEEYLEFDQYYTFYDSSFIDICNGLQSAIEGKFYKSLDELCAIICEEDIILAVSDDKLEKGINFISNFKVSDKDDNKSKKCEVIKEVCSVFRKELDNRKLYSVNKLEDEKQSPDPVLSPREEHSRSLSEGNEVTSNNIIV